MAALTKNDLKIGSVYRAKKPIKKWNLRRGEYFNDREIIWIGDDYVQYDGPAVRHGGMYPQVRVDAFLEWAGSELVEDVPEADIAF